MSELQAEKEETIFRKISELWTDFNQDNVDNEDIPDFLKDTYLPSLIANRNGWVVQVLDMRKFKSIYASPNIEEVTGYTPAEVNNFGLWQYLKNLSMKELMFQLKNAQVINKQIKLRGEAQLYMNSVLINGGIKMKNPKMEKRIISTNFTIGWDEKGKQKYILSLWKDASHIFKTKDTSVRHVFGRENPTIWSYNVEKGKFLNVDLVSDREYEILRLLTHGKISKEIGDELQISSFTVDNHRKNMINRFQVKNTSDLVEVSKWIGLV
jgi:DNA-binding CsgD family transcriptional regulator